MPEAQLALALLTLLERIAPKVRDAVKRGEVSTEEQKALRVKYDALRAAGPAAFVGPEWEIT